MTRRCIWVLSLLGLAATLLLSSSAEACPPALGEPPPGEVAAQQQAVIAFELVDVEGLVGSRDQPTSQPTAPRLGADRLLFLVFAVALFAILAAYKRERSTVDRIRLVGAAGLVATIFMTATFAMPWTSSPAGTLCSLGAELQCLDSLATLAAHAQPRLDDAPLLAMSIRAGQLTLILFLMPALIGLMVSPRSRLAQALVFGAGLPAVFLGANTLSFYALFSNGPGGAIRRAGAADLTLLASMTIVFATVSILLARRQLCLGAPVASAIVVRPLVAKQCKAQVVAPRSGDS